ncbi:hypothetical protein NE686_18110 [Tissierella carlieri]|uniref:Succinate dehydrogenase hydrophobic membrane anchor subunit n=1 Tax=Tissierella carlieri TaxID=689904 RepID=A0ABT1SEY4_9FIRM|nr:hypothetical protein [Tissierella carlieri]MCQ4925021.1 hypothetical protein [Tissierella carlieri]
MIKLNIIKNNKDSLLKIIKSMLWWGIFFLSFFIIPQYMSKGFVNMLRLIVGNFIVFQGFHLFISRLYMESPYPDVYVGNRQKIVKITVGLIVIILYWKIYGLLTYLLL